MIAPAIPDRAPDYDVECGADGCRATAEAWEDSSDDCILVFVRPGKCGHPARIFAAAVPGPNLDGQPLGVA